MISDAINNLLYFLAEQIVEDAEREEAAAEAVAEPREEAQNLHELKRTHSYDHF